MRNGKANFPGNVFKSRYWRKSSQVFFGRGNALHGPRYRHWNVLKTRACTTKLKSKEQIRRVKDFAGYPNMRGLNIAENIPLASTPAGGLDIGLSQH